MRAEHLAQLSQVEIGILIVVALASLPLLYLVHRMLDRVRMRHVTRYCDTHGIRIDGWRIAAEFDTRGAKTENTRIEVLTADGKDGRRVFRFIVRAMGIRSVSEHPFVPDDEQKSNG